MNWEHVLDGIGYAQRVVAGETIACEFVKAACQRQLTELSNQSTDDFPYYFDMSAGEKIIDWVQSFGHVKGEWARRREPLVLEPWQKFIWSTLFGWKRVSDDTRRFRESYILVPRKNGKSAQIAPVGLYMLAADGEEGSEVYCGATTEKQAWEVFTPARAMAQREPDFIERFDIEVKARNISSHATMSKFEPLIGDPGDGSNPHFAIVDEYHEHDTSKLYDTMLTGMGSRTQPLITVITTAGYNLAGPCYAMEQRVKKMLQGTIDDPTLFGIIYTIDKDDDWKSPEALIKANPNYGVSVKESFLVEQQKTAINNPSKQNIFKTKHLNLWCNARDPWLNMVTWEKQKRTDIKREQFKGCKCVMGIDLAQKIDLNAVAWLFEKDDHYFVFCDFFLPEDALESAVNRDTYAGWAAEGWITLTDGAMVDYNTIQDHIKDNAEKYSVIEIPFDQYQAMQLVGNLEKEGLTMVQYGQTVVNMSDPMKEIQGWIEDGKLWHDGNPVLTWCMSNVVCKPDAKDNIYPRKEREDYKIDGAIAAIMATGRMLANIEDEEIDEGFVDV